MPSRLTGRIAIVTGAAQGIGATYAAALGAEGARVCVSDVADTAASARAVETAGGEALGLRCDVSDAASVKAMVDAVIARWGRIDILVNNAGIFGNLSLKPIEEISSAEFDRVMAVNVRGSFECVKAVVPRATATGLESW